MATTEQPQITDTGYNPPDIQPISETILQEVHKIKPEKTSYKDGWEIVIKWWKQIVMVMMVCLALTGMVAIGIYLSDTNDLYDLTEPFTNSGAISMENDTEEKNTMNESQDMNKVEYSTPNLTQENQQISMDNSTDPVTYTDNVVPFSSNDISPI